MEKILKLYTYVDGVNDTPFPNDEYQVVTSTFRSDYKRMGGAPSITCTIMHPMCLDKLWTYGVYAMFNGERFFIKQIPSSSFDNTDARYKHDLELVSERIILDNVYVYDVVDSDAIDDKPVSNSSKFTFFGTVKEFAQRLNQSLRYSGLDYTIVVDDGVTSDGKMVSFENQFFTNALQEIYNIYELPYYFVGKVIHIGYTSNAITHTFKYGQDESLLSIQKQNANYKIVNRVTGVGSADNIPYYYPNDDEKGETDVLYNQKKGLAYVSNPSKYKSVKLSDTFNYSYSQSYAKTLVDEKGRSSDGYLVQVDENVFEIGNVTYPFTIDSISDTMFEIGYLDENLVSIAIDIFEGNNQMMSTSQTGTFSRRYKEGDYSLRITLQVRLDGVNIESEVNVDDVLKNISLLVYQMTEYKNSWFLNGTKKVELSDYGLSINGTPSDGDTITFKRVGYMQPQSNLMPSIYRDTLGKERFYDALNNTYVSPETGEYYEFENQYVDGHPREHIVNFDDIKPSIVGITNSENQRIDMFLEFAYDEDDNDEFDEEGNYLHPYFFAKLRRFDGVYGFNLFDHSIDEDEMVISMTSGSCGSCEFIIGVTEDTQKNIVQVNEYGNLKRDDKGNVIRSGTPQDRQNDTRNNEVWIALKKDINTFGVIMPNAEYKYKPSTDDTFVILHIDLPKAYILAAEDRLKEQLIKYMATNNVEKFNFSISFSRIFFAENPHILAQLDENARIQIEYDGTRHELYVSSYSYNMSSDNVLPEIKVELSDTLSVSQNALQNAISDVKKDIMSSVGSIDFLKQGLKYFLRKDTSDRTSGKLSSDVGFEVGEYVSGSSGAIVYKDAESGQTIGELDKLYVRMKAYFETLEIINVNTIGGKQILSPAGSIKCVGVEETNDAYRCYFLAEQDGEKIENRWVYGDQAYSQIFNAKQGISNKVSNTYYWRLVIGATIDAIYFEGKQCHYIDLSKTDCDKDSDIPRVGDVINQRGSRTDIDRMNFIEWSSVDAFSPNITLFHGVNSYSLDGKAYVDFGVDKTTNKAFMNVYGEMYVGDRNGESYMRYTQEGGLEINGTLSVGTKLGDTPLKDLIAASSPESFQEFVEKVTNDIEGLQQQIDGAIESYFYQYHPTLDNYPANGWVTNQDKESHLNDTFTSLSDGRSWRWTIEDGRYDWTEITDTATTQALALAGKAQDTADGKRRVFVSQPKPPYDSGDLWSQGKDFPLMICVNPKTSTQSYDASDFDYADNNASLKQEMQDLVSNTKDELNNTIGRATEAANAYADKGINDAKQALENSIDELNKAKANANDVYSKAEADGVISQAEADAIKAADDAAKAAIALADEQIRAYADGEISKEEEARIKQAQENLQAAKDYADQKAQEAFNEINGYEYLKLALNDAKSTTIDNGLVLTSLIQLRDKSGSVMSGINGLSSSVKLDKSIATWWGGNMNDLADYYDWSGNEWKPKSGVTIPTSIPSGLIRFDGTGYLAKGKFWWDNNGKIYADPTALFLMFDVEDEAKSLSTTILAMLDKQTEFANMWSVKTDKNGNKYLYSKYSLATQGGISMYSDATTLDIPSIYDGLPIDGTTIYWDGKVLKAKVGTEGGITEITSSMIAEALGYTPYSASNPSGYITIAALNGYATQDWVTKQGFLTQHQDLSGYQTKITDSNKLAYSLISGTPTSLKNPTSLKFGSKSYDGSSEQTIFASDLGALTSHQTIYALTFQSGTFSAGSFTANSAAKTINIPTTTSHISEGNNLYFTNARAVNALADTLKAYVTLEGEQVISGKKNFTTGGLFVNGSQIKYVPLDNNKGYWKLEGDLLVTGGVTMYGNDSSYKPSTIMDAINVDGTTISKEGGVLKVIGGTGGGTADSVAWNNITGKPNFASVATSGKYSDLSGTPTSLKNPTSLTFGSKSYDGSAAQTITASDLGALTSHQDISHLLSKTDASNTYQTKITTSSKLAYSLISGTPTLASVATSGKYDDLIGKPTLLSSFTDDVVSGKYLPLSGGELSGDLYFTARGVGTYMRGAVLCRTSLFSLEAPLETESASASRLPITITWRGGYEQKGGLKITDSSTAYLGGNTILHSSNYSSYALPLSGGTLTNPLKVKCANGPYIEVIRLGALGNVPYIRYSNENGGVGEIGVAGGDSEKAYPVFWDIKDNTGWHTIWHSGNDGSGGGLDADFLDGKHLSDILASNVASATKLQTARTIWGQSFDGTGNVSGGITGANFIMSNGTNGYFVGNREDGAGATDGGLMMYTYGGTPISFWAGGAERMRITSSGDVGIGTTNPSKKLHIYSASSSYDALMLLEKGGAYDVKLELANNTDAFRIIQQTSGNAFMSLNGNHSLHFETSNTVRMTIDGAGNLGIGTTTPQYKLDVNGALNVGGHMTLSTGFDMNGVNMFVYLYDAICVGSRYFNTVLRGYSQEFQIQGTNAMIIDGSCNVGIGTTNPSSKLHVAGNILATGGITMYSMRALKNVVDERGLSLSELSAIKPTRYTWKDGRDNRLHFGGIADDIQQVLPEVVYKTSEGILTMDYGNAAFAIASSLIRPIVNHEERIVLLEEENKQLRQEVERLKSA